MLKIKDIFKKKKEPKKLYDFDYTICFKNNKEITGNIRNSKLKPEKIFLNDAITYFNKGKVYYYNTNEIQILEITNLVEKVEE